MNVLWLILDVTDVENLDLMVKLIFVQIVAIELHVLVQVMEVDNIEKDGKLYQVLQILRSSRLRISIPLADLFIEKAENIIALHPTI